MAKDELTSVGFKLTPEEKKKLEEYAKENDLNISQVMRRALKEFLQKKDEG